MTSCSARVSSLPCARARFAATLKAVLASNGGLAPLLEVTMCPCIFGKSGISVGSGSLDCVLATRLTCPFQLTLSGLNLFSCILTSFSQCSSSLISSSVVLFIPELLGSLVCRLNACDDRFIESGRPKSSRSNSLNCFMNPEFGSAYGRRDRISLRASSARIPNVLIRYAATMVTDRDSPA